MLSKAERQKLDDEGYFEPKKIGKNTASAFFQPRYIPIEVWNQVFNYVAVKDLKRLSLTCKSFYQTIGLLPDAMDRILLRIRQTMKLNELGELLKSSRNYRKIEITIYSGGKEFSGSKRRIFQKFLEVQAGSIIELKLINYPVNECSHIFEFMVNLKNLTMETEESEIFKPDQSFICKSVKTLRFNISGNISDASFVSFIKKFPKIEEVKVQTNINFMKVIDENCPNLKKITMHGYDDGAFKDVSFKNLLELVIEDISIKFDQDINMNQAAEGAFENLEILKIEDFNIVVTLPSLLWIIENIKNLKHLEIESGYRLAEEDLCKNSRHFKNLKVIKISFVNGPLAMFTRCLKQFPELHFNIYSNIDSWYFSDSE